MDSGWTRETRVCHTIDLRPDLLAALRASHRGTRARGCRGGRAGVLRDDVAADEEAGPRGTHGRRAASRSLRQAVVVTPTRLIWRRRTDDDDAFAAVGAAGQARADATTRRVPPFALMPDHGLQVEGVAATQGRIGHGVLRPRRGPRRRPRALRAQGGRDGGARRGPARHGGVTGGTMDESTIACRRCGRIVTAQAPRCPECGADPRTGMSGYRDGARDRVRVCEGVVVTVLRLRARLRDPVRGLLPDRLVRLPDPRRSRRVRRRRRGAVPAGRCGSSSRWPASSTSGSAKRAGRARSASASSTCAWCAPTEAGSATGPRSCARCCAAWTGCPGSTSPARSPSR